MRSELKGCKRKREVALSYFPSSSADSATKQLRRWIVCHPAIHYRLRRVGYMPSKRYFSPLELKYLEKMLG